MTSTHQTEFPSTRTSWIEQRLRSGADGEREVCRHVMEAYARPLERYLLGSSYRSLGEETDLVHGFFADRVSRSGYFHEWALSGKPLRRWLMNGFLFYLGEELRRRRRRQEPLESELPDEREVAHRRFEREWAQSLVARAVERAQGSCARRGQAEHWALFERHHMHGVPYARLFAEFRIEPSAAAAMVRTASDRLRKAIFHELARDGVPDPEIEAELVRLLEALRS